MAMAAAARLEPEPTELIKYNSSQGRLLVIGTMQALEIASRFSGDLHLQRLLTEAVQVPDPVLAIIHQGGRALAIEGYLGNFRLTLGEPEAGNRESVKVDLILDLSTSPLLAMAMPPPGYLHAGDDESEIEAAIHSLCDLVGDFKKPAYINYDASICAHGRSGKIACTRCIDGCPAEAITSLVETVKVDPNLCQGGGLCATVCPSGAMQYSYPGSRDMQERIYTLLKHYGEAGGSDPIVLFYSEDDVDPAEFRGTNLLPVVVEELASIGLEVWLATLAFGARRLLLVSGESLPSKVRQMVEQELDTAHQIIAAMGYPTAAITLLPPESLAHPVEPMMPEITPAGLYALANKRESSYMAIDHLYQQAQRSRPMVQLSAGAPFGMAEVDAGRCTLCLSCVSACPGKALQSGQGEPQLKFIEANCLQCGICTHTCPEDAIWITPRLLFERSARIKSRLLYADEPFCCSVCARPFATVSVINQMQTKLQGHSMFQSDRARHRLTMCDTCRVVDVIQEGEALENGQSALL